MNPLALYFLALMSLPSSWGCPEGIIPSYHFKNLAENTEFDDEMRTWTNQTYLHMEYLRTRRKSAPQEERITEQCGDDQDYDLEQDPGCASELTEEESALHTADHNSPRTGLIPPGAPRGHEVSPHERKRRRRFRTLADREDFANSPERRQSMTLARYTYTDYNTAPSVDLEVNNVFTSLSYVYQLYWNVYSRRTFNGRQMLYGEGDDVMLNIGTLSPFLTTAGHEVTHGIIQYSNPLDYNGQSGALNEHLSDVLAFLLCRKGIPTEGGALRGMKAPGTAYNTKGLGKDCQPANMKDYYAGPQDNLGVHVNSGTLNHAFYLFAQSVGGNAWDIPGHIWYNFMNGGQGTFSYTSETFATFAQRTIRAVTKLCGTATATRCHQAWVSVGVLT